MEKRSLHTDSIASAAMDLIVTQVVERAPCAQTLAVDGLLEWVLLARGNERIFTVSAPWYVGERI